MDEAADLLRKAFLALVISMAPRMACPPPAVTAPSAQAEVHAEESEAAWTMPADPIAEGTAGVKWAIDSSGNLYFEAGELNRDDGWRSEGRELWINEIRVVPTAGCSKLILPEDCSSLFWNFYSLTGIDTARFDTSHVTTMELMFGGCCSLRDLDLSSFETSQVEDLYGMFFSCSALESLDLSGFDTSHVSNMNGMFFSCTGLQNADLSGFDTSHVSNMKDMFYQCESLVSLDLSSFDTSQTENAKYMFRHCHSLESIDLSGFDTSRLWDDRCEYLLEDCPSLQRINLSQKFFNGNLVNSGLLAGDIRWVLEDQPDNVKTWSEMTRAWTDEDAGWRILSCSSPVFDTGEGTEIEPLYELTGSSID